MTDRERAKEALLKALGDSYLGPPCSHSPIWNINLDAMLDAVILVVDPIIRADERSKVRRPDAHQMMLEHYAARARATELANELADLREEIAADIEAQVPFTTHSDDCECADCTTRNVMLSCVRIVRGGLDE